MLELFLEPLEDLVREGLLLLLAVLDQALHLGLGLLDFLEGRPLFGELLPVDVDLREEYLLSGRVVVLGLLVVRQVAEAQAEGVGPLLNFLEGEVHVADFLQLFVVVGDLFGEQGDVADRFVVLELLGGYLLLHLEYLPLELLHSFLPLLQLALEALLVLLFPHVLDPEGTVELQLLPDLCGFFVELLLLPRHASELALHFILLLALLIVQLQLGVVGLFELLELLHVHLLQLLGVDCRLHLIHPPQLRLKALPLPFEVVHLLLHLIQGLLLVVYLLKLLVNRSQVVLQAYFLLGQVQLNILKREQLFAAAVESVLGPCDLTVLLNELVVDLDAVVDALVFSDLAEVPLGVDDFLVRRDAVKVVSLGDVEPELIGLDEHVLVEGVVDDLGQLFVEVLPVRMRPDLDPLLVHEGVAVLHVGEGLLLERLPPDDVDGQDVDLLALDPLVRLYHVLARLLVLHQQRAQLAQPRHLVGESH